MKFFINLFNTLFNCITALIIVGIGVVFLFRAVISDSKLNIGTAWTPNQKSELINVFKNDPNRKFIEFEVRSDISIYRKIYKGILKYGYTEKMFIR